jgi:hypothetical protein
MPLPCVGPFWQRPACRAYRGRAWRARAKLLGNMATPLPYAHENMRAPDQNESSPAARQESHKKEEATIIEQTLGTQNVKKQSNEVNYIAI